MSDAQDGLFDEVEALFQPFTEIHGITNNVHPNELLNPLYQAYLKRLEEIDRDDTVSCDTSKSEIAHNLRQDR